MEALTMDDLIRRGMDKCGTPGCDAPHKIIYLNQRCHPGADTQTFIDFENKTATVECKVCERKVVVLAIAAHPAVQ